MLNGKVIASDILDRLLAIDLFGMNPGEFDERDYFLQKSIFATAELGEGNVDVLAAPRGWSMEQLAYSLKLHMDNALMAGIDPDEPSYALMQAMLYGYKKNISPETLDAFRNTGTLHLFAVSGQNVSTVILMMLVVFRLLGWITWRWAWVALPLVLVFCLATGFGPSAQRAFLMAAIAMLGWRLYRPMHMWSVVGASCVAMLLLSPLQLYDAGFQLSYLVVSGILFFSPRLTSMFYEHLKIDPWIPPSAVGIWLAAKDHAAYFFAALIAVSFAAWLASMPVSLLLFHHFSPVAIASNILIVPLATLSLILCSLSVASGFVSVYLSMPWNWANGIILHLILTSATWLNQVPSGHWNVGLQQWFSQNEQFTILHVDQSQSVIIKTGGGFHLVNPGKENEWKFTVDPAARYFGINSWSGLWLNHLNESNMGGATFMMEQQSRRSIPVYQPPLKTKSSALRSWLAYAEENLIPKSFLFAGDTFRISGTTVVHVLWPDLRVVRSREAAYTEWFDRGTVLCVEQKGVRILLAGSISGQLERDLIELYPNLKCDVLVQSPNKSALNLSDIWLEHLKPRLLVRGFDKFHVDAALNNRFMRLADKLGTRVLELRKTGAVTLSMDDGLQYDSFVPASP